MQDVPTSRLLIALRSFGEADLKQDPNSTLPLDIALANTALGPEATACSSRHGRNRPTAGVVQTAPHRHRRTGVADVAAARARFAGAAEERPARRQLGCGRPANAAASSACQPTSPEALEGPGAEPSTSLDSTSEPAPTPRESVPASLAAVKGQMRAIYEAARARVVPLGALINGGDIIAADEETSVTFGLKFEFHVKTIVEKYMPVLTEVVSSVLGRPVTIRAVHDPSVEEWRQRETTSRSPLVRAAQEMGARVLSPEPEE